MMVMILISAVHTSRNSEYRDLQYLETPFPCNVQQAEFSCITQVTTAQINRIFYELGMLQAEKPSRLG
jgi:hypothetical protein